MLKEIVRYTLLGMLGIGIAAFATMAHAGQTPEQFNTSQHGVSAGAASVAAAISNPIAGVQNFTIQDLQNALADANAQVPPDTRHGQCWAALIPFVQGINPNGILPKSAGLAQVIQKGFDLQVTLGKPLFPDNVVQACSLVVSDLNSSFVKLAGAVGLVAAAPIKVPLL